MNLVNHYVFFIICQNVSDFKMIIIPVFFAVAFLSVGVSSLQCWHCESTCKTRYDTRDINDGTSHGLCLEESGCSWGNDSIKMTCSEGVNHCIKLDNKTDGSMYYN